MNDPSPSLLQRAAAGDRQALGDLLVRALPQLEAYVRLQAGAAVRARESICDLVQSVCGEALADLDRFEFRGEPQFRHWLARHALHKIINRREYWQAHKRDIRREQPAADSAGAASVLSHYASICTPSRHASAREELARVEAAFDRIEPDYREAVVAHKMLGVDYPDLAAAMQRSEGAVRNLVYRGLARLAALLDAPDPPR
ncbi:MAG: sigma-70 family RNA polymerase sigma factor [Planctomycetes bacterium]|nr:sigma-70 family RNA polymerase sigma factor [Planctomycetota bacterium]